MSFTSTKPRAGDKDVLVTDDLPEVVALWDYNRRSPHEISFRKGDRIAVHGNYDEVWWKGQIGDQVGFFACQYVSGLDEIELEEPSSGNESLQDDEYFGEYSGLKIHHEMLSDKSRTCAYRDAIAALSRLHIKGRIVLDIGCGSGVLSIFAAKAGAQTVFGVDASDILAKATKKLVEANKLGNQITLIKSKIEELKLPVKQVDVIISEWMGTFLVAEAMIDSVIRARDKFLKPGGLMMPCYAQVLLCPVTDSEFWEEKIEFWRNVYQIDMSPLIPLAKDEFFRVPCHSRIIQKQQLLSKPQVIWNIDMYKVSIKDLEKHVSEFRFYVSKPGHLHCFGAWFDVAFMSRSMSNPSGSHPSLSKPTASSNVPGAKSEGEGTSHVCSDAKRMKLGDVARHENKDTHTHSHMQPQTQSDDSKRDANSLQSQSQSQPRSQSQAEEPPVWLSTSPFHPPTHWKHTLLFLDDPPQVELGDEIQGSLIILRNPTLRRHFSLDLSVTIKRKDRSPEGSDEKQTADYRTVYSLNSRKFFMWR
mmetsp:Transcript_20114/g.28052  ORF Transcript_20114/g.28052 Transcript_20114/m.28052 type:complete len:531 (-) Transcript_20114:104-1696(-)